MDLEKVRNLIKDIIEDLGYELVDIKYTREMGRKSLVIYIDKEGDRISINDCEKVSKAIDKIIEDADLIKESYNLIVSSPLRE
jgi:ribosome maturation factor RimP